MLRTACPVPVLFKQLAAQFYADAHRITSWKEELVPGPLLTGLNAVNAKS